MSEEKLSYIIFIQWGKSLPKEFVHLAQVLNLFGLTLIPVPAQHLSEFIKGEKRIIVSVTKDLVSYRNSVVLKKQLLKMALNTGRIHLIEASSFSIHEDLIKYQKQDHYQFLKLPIKMKELARSVLKLIGKKEIAEQKWPGGRRARLPAM